MKNLCTTGLILVAILNIYILCGAAAINNDTGIKISNEMTQIDEKQVQMLYKIVTPKIIHYDFVLALDSSGSFGEKSTQHKAVLRDVPRFLSKITKYYPDAYFNISLISWDNNIDFAYDKKLGYVEINKIEPVPYKLSPLENVTKNFNEFNVLYKNKQTEGTDYSVPIKASLDIFNTPENMPKDPLHTMRFIVMVTGNGEYTPCNPDLLQEASNGKIGIYTIGLDIGRETELYEYLKDISRNKIAPTPSESGLVSNLRIVDTTPFETELNKTLEAALREHFESIMNTSVADNIELSDRLFGYYKLKGDSLSVVTKKSNSITRSQTAQSGINYNPISDRTAEVKVKIYELLPNSTTNVAYIVENTFNPMALPVTVTEHNGPLVICSPQEHADPMLRYTWHVNGQKKELPLDIAKLSEGHLTILSANETNLNETPRREDLGFLTMLISLLFGSG